jgi:signal transduction histidine kinase
MSDGYTKTETALLEALERERATLRQRELINGIVVHEMANAVTIVVSTTDLLTTSAPGSVIHEFALQQLRGGARTLNDLLGGLRVLVDRSGASPVFAKGDLDGFVRTTVTDPVLVANTAPGRVLFLNRAPAYAGAFCASLLRIALANLVRNALRYSPTPSQVRVIVTTRGAHLWIHVRNRGEKITKEIAEHIFEPGRKGSHGGMGLGLHITRECMQKMGGELRYGSTRAGSVFSLRLPWREPPPPAFTPAPVAALQPPCGVTSKS